MRAFRIRRGRPTDFDPLLELFEAVASEGRWIGTEPGFDRARYRAAWESNLVDPRRPLFVATQQQQIVGMLGVNEHDEFGPTLGMLVAANVRGSGVGTALLDACVAWARAQRLPALHLLVFPHNTRARDLYLRKGFVEIERFKRDVIRRDGSAWDSILMTLHLA